MAECVGFSRKVVYKNFFQWNFSRNPQTVASLVEFQILRVTTRVTFWESLPLVDFQSAAWTETLRDRGLHRKWVRTKIAKTWTPKCLLQTLLLDQTLEGSHNRFLATSDLRLILLRVFYREFLIEGFLLRFSYREFLMESLLSSLLPRASYREVVGTKFLLSNKKHSWVLINE